MARFVKLRPKLDSQDPFLSFDKVYTIIQEGAEFTEFEDMCQIRYGTKKKDIGWFWTSRFINVEEKDLGVGEHLAIIKEETK